MSGACGCGRCYGCRLAWEAGERYDTSREEAEEQAEIDEWISGLAEYVDQDGWPFAASVNTEGEQR